MLWDELERVGPAKGLIVGIDRVQPLEAARDVQETVAIICSRGKGGLWSLHGAWLVAWWVGGLC